MRVFIGLDVGKDGGIGVIRSDIHGKEKVTGYKMPQIGNEIDTLGICKILENEIAGDVQAVLVIEDVHSIFNVSANSNFQFGRAAGILEGLVVGLKIPFYKVAPKDWQKVCFEGVKVITKPGSRAKGRGAYDTKAMALIAINRLYPHVNLLATERSKKPHNGIVDAILIAHYAKLFF